MRSDTRKSPKPNEAMLGKTPFDDGGTIPCVNKNSTVMDSGATLPQHGKPGKPAAGVRIPSGEQG